MFAALVETLPTETDRASPTCDKNCSTCGVDLPYKNTHYCDTCEGDKASENRKVGKREREKERGVRENKRERRERESLTSVPFSCRSSVLLVESDSTADTTCSPMCPTRFVLFIFLLVSHVFPI